MILDDGAFQTDAFQADAFDVGLLLDDEGQLDVLGVFADALTSAAISGELLVAATVDDETCVSASVTEETLFQVQ